MNQQGPIIEPQKIKHITWAPCQIRKIVDCACTGNAGNVSPPPRVSNPDMHHDTSVTHVPWCTPGSLTKSSIWSRWRGKRSRHSQRMHIPHFCVSGKRPMVSIFYRIYWIPRCPYSWHIAIIICLTMVAINKELHVYSLSSILSRVFP